MKSQWYYTDPSGTFWQCNAKAVGSGSEGADSSLQEQYNKEHAGTDPHGGRDHSPFYPEAGYGRKGDPEQRRHRKGLPQLPPLHPCRGRGCHRTVVKHLPLCATVSLLSP